MDQFELVPELTNVKRPLTLWRPLVVEIPPGDAMETILALSALPSKNLVRIGLCDCE